MKLIKKFSFLFVLLLPVAVFSQTSLTPQELSAQMQKLLAQYAEKIRILEAENIMLRNLMAKHEIQIPLEEYNKIFSDNNTSTTPDASVISPNTHNQSAITPIKQGFIDQFKKDWPDVRRAYSMPENAFIGAYEFVKNDKENTAYVDIVYGEWTPEWAYNAKLLYEFNKENFKRTLIGFFEYNTTTKVYVTKKWKNPFAGIEREVVREAAPVMTPTSNANPSTPVVNTADSSALKIESDMLNAYNKKDYNSLLKISDSYLKNSQGTYKIYLYRYRSYFLLGQYTQALGEIKKMENIKLADEKIYCDAAVVAQYAKDAHLSSQYKKMAWSGCIIKS